MEQAFDLEEIKEVAEKLLKKIDDKKSKNAVILALSGDLGAGKTTLTQQIGDLLGIKEKIVSPTFVIMKKYNIPNKKFEKLIHIDAYRLKNSKDLFKLGWKNLTASKNLIIVEWPELVPECFDRKDVIKIFLEHKNKKTRIIKI